MMTADLRIHVLGGFRVVSSGSTVAVSPNAARLLARLAVHDQPVPRSRIAGDFWPTLTERRALANVRAAVWRLTEPCRSLVSSTGTLLSIADFVQVDLKAASDVVHDLLAGQVHVHPKPAAVALLCQPLLPGWNDEWLAFERERIRQLHIHALEILGQMCLRTGDSLSAVDIGIRCVGAEPLRESAHVLLIQAYLACGNRADARRCYDHYSDLLRRELDLEPGVDWAELAVSARHATPVWSTPTTSARNAANTPR